MPSAALDRLLNWPELQIRIRSSYATGLRRRACAYLRRNCHANPIRWLADGFARFESYMPPASPVSARQKVNVARTMASERARGCCCACFVFALQRYLGCQLRRETQRKKISRLFTQRPIFRHAFYRRNDPLVVRA